MEHIPIPFELDRYCMVIKESHVSDNPTFMLCTQQHELQLTIDVVKQKLRIPGGSDHFVILVHFVVLVVVLFVVVVQSTVQCS